MNRKLKRLIEDEERTIAKIEELQSHLKDVRTARKQEEDLEIVRSIRTMKLGARDLFQLLSGIQDGSVSIESLPIPEDPEQEAESPDDSEETLEMADLSEMNPETENNNHNQSGTEEVPESEDNHE